MLANFSQIYMFNFTLKNTTFPKWKTFLLPVIKFSSRLRRLWCLVTGQKAHWSRFSCIARCIYFNCWMKSSLESCNWLRSILFVLVSNIQEFPLCSLFLIRWFSIECVFIIILLLSEQSPEFSSQWLSAEKQKQNRQENEFDGDISRCKRSTLPKVGLSWKTNIMK